MAREFRAALVFMVGKFCVKSSPGRKLYDSGRLVLRLSAFAADGSDLRTKSYFLGFGNLVDSVFTVKVLQPASDDPRLVLPHTPDDLELLSAAGVPSDLVVVADQMLPADSCTLELCGLVVDSDVIFPNFVPLVAVRQGEIKESFWPPQRAGGRGGGPTLLPIHARAARPLGPRGPRQATSNRLLVIRDIDDDAADVTAGDRCVLDVLQAEEYAEAWDLVAPWAFDDSSESGS